MAPFDSISQSQLIAHIVSRLKRERTRQPAFTLLLGSGFSAPLIPTAGQVVASDVAWWLHWRQEAKECDLFSNRPGGNAEVRAFELGLWTKVHEECGGSFRLKDGMPEMDAENIGAAYRAIMSGRATSGLSDPQWRRRYLRDLCSRIGDRVNGAHIFLASILRAQERWEPGDGPLKRPFCRTIFTTNFDPLLQRSLQLVSRLYFMSDRPEALEPPEDDDHDAVHLVYSHGSVHRYLLLNTEEEIAAARTKNAASLVRYFERHGVLVVGYSGWQDATMDALSQCQSFGGNLYWCDVHQPEEAEKRLSAEALDLIARKRGNAFYVPIAGADELMLALHRELGLGDAPGFIRDPIGQMIEDLVSIEVPDARGPASEPRAIDSLKSARDRTVARLRAAQRAFEEPARLEGGGAASLSADDQRVFDQAITARLQEAALEKMAKGRLNEAIELWAQVIRDPKSSSADRALASVNRGLLLGLQGRRQEAIEDYSAVIAMADAPSNERARALLNRGTTHGQQARLDEAIADFTSAMAISDAPAHLRATALVNRGIVYGTQDRSEEEIADYTAAIGLVDAPADLRAKALVNRGIAHQRGRRLEQALADFDAVAGMPDVPDEFRGRALRGANLCKTRSDLESQGSKDASAIDERTSPPRARRGDR